MAFNLQAQTQKTIKLGTQLQNQQGLEVLDLSSVSNASKVGVTVHRDSMVDNLVSFYKVQDDGSVTDSLTGEKITATKENQGCYIRAALANRVEGLDISGDKDAQTTLSGELKPGEIYAPMMIFDPDNQMISIPAEPE
jgi:hypothetical protein